VTPTDVLSRPKHCQSTDKVATPGLRNGQLNSPNTEPERG